MRSWRVNNSRLFKFAIGLSENKCLQGKDGEAQNSVKVRLVQVPVGNRQKSSLKKKFSKIKSYILALKKPC